MRLDAFIDLTSAAIEPADLARLVSRWRAPESLGSIAERVVIGLREGAGAIPDDLPVGMVCGSITITGRRTLRRHARGGPAQSPAAGADWPGDGPGRSTGDPRARPLRRSDVRIGHRPNRLPLRTKRSELAQKRRWPRVLDAAQGAGAAPVGHPPRERERLHADQAPRSSGISTHWTAAFLPPPVRCFTAWLKHVAGAFARCVRIAPW